MIQRYNAVLLHDCFVKEEEKVHSSLIFVLFLYCTAHFFHSMGIEYRGQKNNNNLSPQLEWHLDRFIRFCRAHACDRQTDTHRDTQTTLHLTDDGRYR